MAKSRLNDTQAISGRAVPVSSNPDVAGTELLIPTVVVAGATARPRHPGDPSPDRSRPLAGAVCYLNQGIKGQDCP